MLDRDKGSLIKQTESKPHFIKTTKSPSSTFKEVPDAANTTTSLLRDCGVLSHSSLSNISYSDYGYFTGNVPIRSITGTRGRRNPGLCVVNQTETE